MDRRRHPRISAQFSVQVWGVDAFSQPFAQVARVKDISAGGAVIQGLTHSVRLGGILEVQLEHDRTQFRVVRIQKGEVALAKLATEPALLEMPAACYAQCVGNG